MRANLLLLTICLTCCMFLLSSAFTWHIDEEIFADDVLTYSEQYLYGSHNGPFMLPQGKSTIDSKLHVKTR